MAIFDQRGQNVTGNQYNANHDMTIHQSIAPPFFSEKRVAQPNKKLRQAHLPNKRKRLQQTYSLLFCYAREDEYLLDQLKNHLYPLQQQGIFTVWHDRNILPGAEWEQEINMHMNTADIILLLISPDFMASDYCYSIEMRQALSRHEQGDVTVVPIILRPVYWQNTPLSKLQVLPADAQPVVNSGSRTLDEAFFDITEGISHVVEQLTDKPLIK